MIFAALPTALRARLEELMRQPIFADAELTLPPSIRTVLDAGRVEGRVEGRAASIFTILEARSIEIPGDVRKEILGCQDLATLDHWLRRAATLKTARAVVRPPRKSGG